MQGTDGPEGGPIVLRIALGTQLRSLREAAGITRDEAGFFIRASAPKISRMELGRVGFKERDIIDLLKLYGVKDPKETDRLLALAMQANMPGWWHRYGDVVDSWFQPYLGLETAAAMIRTFEWQFIPGLLQTADYARAVIALGSRNLTAEQIDECVDLRLQRQRVFARSSPLRLWAVLDEAVLRRHVGGSKVMRAQIKTLIESLARPNIIVQILPFSAGGHAANGGAFSILRLEHPQVPDIVYVEHLISAQYFDKPEDLDIYGRAMESLSVQGEPPDRTIPMLQALLKE